MNRPAVVLSSTQSADVLDADRVHSYGLDVVRRTSGGGLVVLLVGAQLWVDFFLPRDDDLWVDDVSHSADWLARLWTGALASWGVAATRPTTGSWSDPELGRIVCFAATGPGEVVVDGRKLVGVSQRRTRAGARFQCTVYRTFPLDFIAGILDTSSLGSPLATWLVDRLSSSVVSLDDLGAPSNPEGGTDSDPLGTLAWRLVEQLP